MFTFRLLCTQRFIVCNEANPKGNLASAVVKRSQRGRLPFGPRSTGAIAYVLAQVHRSFNYILIVLRCMQCTCDAITIAQFGSGGLSLRGVANPLLEYALSNEIGSDHLTMSDGVWTDQETCIARRNWVPNIIVCNGTELAPIRVWQRGSCECAYSCRQ